MIKTSGQFFDGVSSKPIAVAVSFNAGGSIFITSADLDLTTHYDDVKISQRISNIPRSIYLENGSKLEVRDNDVVDEYLKTLDKEQHWGWLHRFEKTTLGIIGAVLVTLVALLIAIEYGIPKLAKHVAQSVPYSAEEKISEYALSFFDQNLVGPSTILQSRQEELKSKFKSVSSGSGVDLNFRFEFRDGQSIGPNAFAFPSGIIIFTDQLVTLVKDDNELLAILAHEVGHVKFRHSLRNLLQSSTTALLIATITGDMASITGLAATLPTVLLETRNSRQFETEADEYAYQFLPTQGIALHHLADALERMTTKEQRQAENSFSYLSTHPVTDERIARFRE